MNYQEKVREAFEILEDAKIKVFTALIQVAMSSEYQDIDELLSDEKNFSFRISDFGHATDPNINTLHHVVRIMEIAEEEMIAWNGQNNLNLQGNG
ncbi:hypothetical protein Aconfl_13300 [Algoriphagus confluentis]|uniref:Uncharacterized protein n=2 Tax=Algoriphagus confluentis TaxID=1697556 RepID=A0ABQ6PPE2_9BACT|nr:hypothetical protein Aconfl_13300 [Algoriphagus confluentis]